MAAPKKTSKSTKKADTKAKKTTTGKTARASSDPVQETLELIKGFQVNTLLAIGLAVLLLIFQLFEDLRYIWWLNIFVAAGSGYLFWRQGDSTKGTEQKICRWGLLAVVALFLWRDIHISQTLADFDKAYGELNDLFS